MRTRKLISYKAIDEIGNIRRGECFADSIVEAQNQLQDKGWIAVSLKNSLWSVRIIKPRSFSSKNLLAIFYEIRQLYSCGLPIIDCLSVVAEHIEDRHLSALLIDFKENINEGKSLSQAMSGHEQLIKPFIINMIRLGEHTGRLEQVLEQLENILSWQLETYEAAKKELIYPVFVAIVVVFCIQFQMVYLVPKLSIFFQQININMPTHTQLLITVATFISDYFIAINISLVVSLCVLVFLYRKIAIIKYHLDKFMLNMIYIGPVIRNLVLARVVKGFSIFHASGMTVVETTLQCQSLTQNSFIKQMLAEIHQRISTGTSLALAFQRHKTFPTLLVRMIQAGELAGKLDQTLSYCAKYLESNAKSSIEKLHKTMTPVMLLLLGGIMIWLVVAIIVPIYANLMDKASFL